MIRELGGNTVLAMNSFYESSAAIKACATTMALAVPCQNKLIWQRDGRSDCLFQFLKSNSP